MGGDKLGATELRRFVKATCDTAWGGGNNKREENEESKRTEAEGSNTKHRDSVQFETNVIFNVGPSQGSPASNLLLSLLIQIVDTE